MPAKKPKKAKGNSTEIVEECIKRLLQAFDARIETEEEDWGTGPIKAIGEIQIIIDAKGEIDARRVLQKSYTRTYATLFLSVKSEKEADVLERILTVWAYDLETLKDVIAVLQPEYTGGDWEEDLTSVAGGISYVLMSAMVVGPGSPRHTILKNAMKKLPLTEYC